MNNSEQVDELYGALALAQGEFPAIPKNKTGKVRGESKGTGKAYEYEYKYADIADVLSAVRPVLSKHGLAILQLTGLDEANVMHIRTRLAHKTGQWVEASYPVCSIVADHQKMGGALTYARRYALTSLLGVAAEDDMDGQHAASVENRPRQRPPAEASKADSRVVFERLSNANRALADTAAFDKFWQQENVKAAFEGLPKDWRQHLVDERRDKAAELAEREAPADDYVPPSFDGDNPFPGDLPPATQAAVRNLGG